MAIVCVCYFTGHSTNANLSYAQVQILHFLIPFLHRGTSVSTPGSCQREAVNSEPTETTAVHANDEWPHAKNSIIPSNHTSKNEHTREDDTPTKTIG